MSRKTLPLRLLSLTLLTLTSLASAEDRFYPLDHRQPVGVAGRWAAVTKPGSLNYIQPVQVVLPSAGHVTYYHGSPSNTVLTNSPSQAGMMLGHVYRVRISGMPEYPGVELYPTIEVIDRLHPPEGRSHEFPIPLQITAEEIETVLDDRMVTKVVYLEQPDLAAPYSASEKELIETLSPTTNLLQAADQRGRPMAIIRIGGRVPDPRSPTDEFYSSSPLQISAN